MSMMIQQKVMTVVEAAAFLRQIAELTASNSGNWENFEAIALGILTAAAESRREQPQSADAVDPTAGTQES